MIFLKKLKSGWTTLKILRVGLGAVILYSSVESDHTGGMIAGSILLLFGLFTDGVCCMTGNCYTTPAYKDSTLENVTYEELDNK